jgi:Flp pilus assembly protein TadD
MDENVKAAEVLSEALKGAPDEASWVLNRGLAYARVDDYKGAIADYSTALDLAPNNNQAYNNRGIIYQRRRMYETAIEDFTKAQVKNSLTICCVLL